MCELDLSVNVIKRARAKSKSKENFPCHKLVPMKCVPSREKDVLQFQ